MELSEDQKTALEQFRKLVYDVKKASDSDGFLLQWLQAREFNVDKAEDMMRQSVAWREKVGADTIVDSYTPPEVLQKYYPLSLCGLDKEGCPVWIACTGYFDVIGILKSVSPDDVIRNVIQIMEISRREMAKQSQLRGKYIGQHIIIMDLEGWTFRNAFHRPGHALILELTKMQEDNYPEMLRNVIIVNAPRYFAFVFNLLKPFMSEVTKRKIIVYDSDRTKWVPAILEIVDEDQLPQHWGGTMVDPDGNPKCPSKIILGGDVPSSYFKSNKADEIDESMEAVTIKSGDKLQLDFTIAQSGSSISWQFQTESHDIGFGICRVDVDEWKEMLPYERVDSGEDMVQGQTEPLDNGKYVVLFDNSFSKIRSKYLYYAIQILPPKND